MNRVVGLVSSSWNLFRRIVHSASPTCVSLVPHFSLCNYFLTLKYTERREGQVPVFYSLHIQYGGYASSIPCGVTGIFH
jgi:hypothetical protein